MLSFRQVKWKAANLLCTKIISCVRANNQDADVDNEEAEREFLQSSGWAGVLM